MSLEQQIESVLFFKNEPISTEKLATLLSVTKKEVDDAVLILNESLKNRGIRLMQNDDDIMLATAPEASEIIATITKEELISDLGKAGLEVLTLVVYKGPISRREIDHIRGVNSSFIIRNLLIRGLIEKTDSKEGDRSFSYKPTFELLSYLGIQNVSEMPEYFDMQKKLEETKIETKDTETKSDGAN